MPQLPNHVASRPLRQYLQKQWVPVARKYFTDEAAGEAVLQRLMTLYQDKRRHYHTLEHVAALLQLCEKHLSLLGSRDVVRFSIWFHDAVFSPLSRHNEERSAQLAVQLLKPSSLPRPWLATIDRYIRATKHHPRSQDPDLQFLIDADLSILGADPETYQRYTQQVRQEYSIYPNFIYNRGRRAFVQQMLAKVRIFQTDALAERYEAAAKKNLAHELQTLR